MQKITDEYIFLQTMEDLRHKTRDNHFDRYDLIRAAGLIRHLYFDNPALVHKVNRNHKIQILYHVSDYTKKDVNTAYFNLRPIFGDTLKIKENDFIKIPILYHDNIPFTVHHIIKSVTTYWGGVHSVDPSDPMDIILKDLNILQRLNFDMVFLCIDSISCVVSDALKPLEEKIKNAS